MVWIIYKSKVPECVDHTPGQVTSSWPEKHPPSTPDPPLGVIPGLSGDCLGEPKIPRASREDKASVKPAHTVRIKLTRTHPSEFLQIIT